MAQKSSLGLAGESGLRTFESLRDAGERGRAAMKSLAAPGRLRHSPWALKVDGSGKRGHCHILPSTWRETMRTRRHSISAWRAVFKRFK